MRLGESSIDYMSRVRGIAQQVHGVTIDRIITLFAIAILYHERYPGMKIRYLAVDTALVNCDLLHLSRKKTTNTRYHFSIPVHHKCKSSIKS